MSHETILTAGASSNVRTKTGATTSQGKRMSRTILIEKPIIVLGCNRSGTTLLFRNLSEHPLTWSLYVESQDIFYEHFPLSLDYGDAVTTGMTGKGRYEVYRAFYERAHNKQHFKDSLLGWLPEKLLQRSVGNLYKRAPMRLVEKTPANCLRIPLLKQLFPDARFLFLIRRPEDTISSLMEGWKNWSRTPEGEEWKFGNWHYIAPPGWQNWRDKPLAEICAWQWMEANRTAWRDLHQHCAGQFLTLRHEDLMARPAEEYRKILDFCELPASAHMNRLLEKIPERVFTEGGSKPRPEKWRALHGRAIDSVAHLYEPLASQLYSA
jgi:hypothetical protein